MEDVCLVEIGNILGISLCPRVEVEKAGRGQGGLHKKTPGAGITDLMTREGPRVTGLLSLS